MSEDVDSLERDDKEAPAFGILPQSLMPSATASPAEAAPGEVGPTRAANGNEPVERPFKEGLLVRLGHRLCGFRR